MAVDMIRDIQVFRESIYHSADYLKEVDFDLIDLLYSESPNYQDDVINSMVAITSIEVSELVLVLVILEMLIDAHVLL